MRISLLSLAVATLPLLFSNPARSELVHPGIAHTQASFDFVKKQLAENRQPWTQAWNDLKASEFASLNWTPSPRAQ